MNTEQIKRKVNKLDPAKDYTTREIVDLGLVFDTNNKPSIFTLLRAIKRGELPSMNWGTERKAQYVVRGKDLIDYLNKRYQVKAQIK